MFVSECLLDNERVQAFQKAIQKVVTPNSVVVDAGTGTGILALLAAQAGAKKVYAVELIPELAEIAKKNIKINNFDHIIEVVNDDITVFKTPEPVDIVTMEMMDTGLIQEYQGPAILSLKKNGVISNDTILLPDKVSCNAQLVEYDFNFYGFQMPSIVQARNQGVRNRILKAISEIKTYKKVDLLHLTSEGIEEILEFDIQTEGLINAIELTTTIVLSNLEVPHTSDMNMPIIVPVKPLKAVRGQKILMKIHYLMGQGFLDPLFLVEVESR
jgi:predicted RNA methylase